MLRSGSFSDFVACPSRKVLSSLLMVLTCSTAALSQGANGYLDFDGSSHFSIASATAYTLSGSAPFSLETRIRAQGTGVAQVILSKYNNQTSGGWELALGNSGEIHFKREASPFWLYGTTSIADGQFHHVVATYNGTTMTIYVDGVANGTLNTGMQSVQSSTPMYLGARRTNGAPDRFLSGDVDYVRIWSTALTSDRISALAGGEVVASDAAGLLGSWSMDSMEDLGVGSTGANDLRDSTTSLRHFSRESGAAQVVVPVIPFTITLQSASQELDGRVRLEYLLNPSVPPPSSHYAVSVKATTSPLGCNAAPAAQDDVTAFVTGDLTIGPAGGTGVIYWDVPATSDPAIRAKYYAANVPVAFSLTASAVSLD